MDSRVATPPGQPGPRASEQDAGHGFPVGGGGDGRGGTPGGYPLLDAFEPPRRPRHGWRLLLGCVIVLMAAAGATAVAVLEQVHTIVQDLSVNKPLKVESAALAQSQYGQPETLLMVGDDTRSVFKYYSGFVPNLANEMLLIRIDPSKPWISMMSLPRELWVHITEPNGAVYTNRLNSAYVYGTTTLLKTIKQVTGVSVNHVIATTFTKFERAINKLGCVYDTIDERYFHDNALGGDQYQNIDLEPGYQCLNGSDAEQFVSYRHTDTSQIRDARDQSFLLAVKSQYGPQLAGNLGEFEKIFGETVQTDPGLRSSTEILNLANLLISAAGLRVRQVHFQTVTCPVGVCPAGDLTANPQQIQDSVHNFLFGGDVTPSRQVAAISHKIHRHGGLAHLPLTATLAANVVGEREVAAKLPFTAEFPRVQDIAGSAAPVAADCTTVMQPCLRRYLIHARSGAAYPIYVEVFSNGDLGQFYDVQGTTWTAAPMFAHPQQSIRVGRRTYELFYSGSHLETIAWREYGAVYWVHNTLIDGVGNGELLAIAEQTAPVGPVRSTPTHVILNAFSVPTVHAPAVKTPLLQSVGQIGGLIALVLFPLGLFVVFGNWRQLQGLRDRAHAAAARTAFLETQLAAAVAGRRLPPAPRVPTFATSARAGTRPGATGSRPPRPTLPYERYRSGRSWMPAALGLAAMLVGVVAYLAVDAGTSAPKRRPRPRAVLSAPVAVLNAGQTPDAAHHLALRLTRRKVDVVDTGNLAGSPPPSYEILYTAGDQGQARLLAKVLIAEHPTIAPIDPGTAQAIGSRPRLVVVIP